MQQVERRRSRRVQFEHPLEGTFSRMQVKVLSLSAAGALVEHDRRLWYASRMPLEFTLDGRHVKLECEVVSSWIERYCDPTTTYRSGLRFLGGSRQLTRALEQLNASAPSTNGEIKNGRKERQANDS